jgi:hypothetical protein
MSSTEFMSTFQLALDLAARNLSGAPGLETALNFLRKAATAPQTNRGTEFFEPVLVSQKLGIPIETAQSLAEELLRYRAFHLWVRVNCPNVHDNGDRVIFETDSPDIFDQKLEEVCPHCGRFHHSPDWNSIEPVFGMNRRGVESQLFENSDFFYDRLQRTAW